MCQGESREGPLHTPLWLSETLTISLAGRMKSSLPARLFLSVDPLPAPEPRAEQAAARCFCGSRSSSFAGILAGVCNPLSDAWLLQQGHVWSGARAWGDDCQWEMGNLTPLVLSASIFSMRTSACACGYIYLYLYICLYTYIHMWGER